jgi:hypothetical protein
MTQSPSTVLHWCLSQRQPSELLNLLYEGIGEAVTMPQHGGDIGIRVPKTSRQVGSAALLCFEPGRNLLCNFLMLLQMLRIISLPTKHVLASSTQGDGVREVFSEMYRQHRHGT